MNDYFIHFPLFSIIFKILVDSAIEDALKVSQEVLSSTSLSFSAIDFTKTLAPPTGQQMIVIPSEDDSTPLAAQIMQAALVSANIENSDESKKQKRKKEDGNLYDSNEPPLTSFIGNSTCNHVVWTEHGKRKVQFLPPVQLTPLVQKSTNSNKKLVPLIEPDICNSFAMDFLTESLLKIDRNIFKDKQHHGMPLTSYQNGIN